MQAAAIRSSKARLESKLVKEVRADGNGSAICVHSSHRDDASQGLRYSTAPLPTSRGISRASSYGGSRVRAVFDASRQ